MQPGYVPAYNAYRYELRIYDGYGHLKYTKNNWYACPGLKNGEITWNGRDDNGNWVNINDTYTYKVTLQNCSGSQLYQGTVDFIQ
jgi:flagellar hook assembly protein FlgD